jgi:hypothetical protein
MLKPGQHDKKNYVIPNLFRNLEFANDNELIAFVLEPMNPRILEPPSLRFFVQSGLPLLFFFRPP